MQNTTPVPGETLTAVISKAAIALWLASFLVAPYEQMRSRTLDWSKLDLPPELIIEKGPEFAGYSALFFAPKPDWDRGFNSVVLSSTPYTIQCVAGLALLLAGLVWAQTRRDRAAMLRD